MGFDPNIRILRSIIPHPENPEEDLVTDFEVFAVYLQTSNVLRELASLDWDPSEGPLFVSEDGVIPLRDEKPEDIALLVQWLARAKGFQINVDNVRPLLRLSDKFEIEYLLSEIKVFAAHWVTQVEPSYDLWELAARYELEYLEKYCRKAARRRADQILAKGEGLAYFVSRGIPIYMLDRIIRALFEARESVIQTDYKGGRIWVRISFSYGQDFVAHMK